MLMNFIVVMYRWFDWIGLVWIVMRNIVEEWRERGRLCSFSSGLLAP